MSRLTFTFCPGLLALVRVAQGYRRPKIHFHFNFSFLVERTRVHYAFGERKELDGWQRGRDPADLRLQKVRLMA